MRYVGREPEHDQDVSEGLMIDAIDIRLTSIDPVLSLKVRLPQWQGKHIMVSPQRSVQMQQSPASIEYEGGEKEYDGDHPKYDAR